MKDYRILCDKCGKDYASTFSYGIGRRCDAAGSMGDVTLDADLCAVCKGGLFSLLLNSMSKELSIEFLRSLKSNKMKPLFEEHF